MTRQTFNPRQVALDLALSQAVRERKTDSVAYLLAQGASPMARDEIFGVNSVYLAATLVDAALLALLLATPQGREAARHGDGDTTALMMSTGSLSCATLLLPWSDPLHVDCKGRDALFIAAGSGPSEVINLLMPLSNPKTRHRDGSDALMSAASMGRVDNFKALMKVFDPGDGSVDGWDALMFCVRDGRLDGVEILLPRSNLSRRTVRGSHSALSLAQHRGYHDIANLIESETTRRALDLGTPLAPAPPKGPSRI